MKYKMIKFPKHLFKETTLTLSEVEGNKYKLTFYKDPSINKKVIVTFTGVVTLKGYPLDKKVTNISLTHTIGFRVMTELQKLNQDHNDYEQLFISFEDGSEMLCGVKNLVIEEVEPCNITFRTRKMVMPGDLNGANTLFGGRCMSFIDEEAAIYAACQMGVKRHVTKLISEIDFESPGYEGDIIEIGCDVVRFGKSSITLKVIVRNKDTKKKICTVDEIVFVAVDENGKPIPHGKTSKKED